ncbi:MAG: hypothetical protein V3U29_07715, partial [Phycisphaeraceae bacterium]
MTQPLVRAATRHIAMLMVITVVAPVLAIQPARWEHTTEADFEPGQRDNVVVTNLGDVKLAARTDVIGQMPEQASVIYDLQALPGGDLYLAAGPEAKLLRRAGDEIDKVMSLEQEQVFALDVYEGKLLVAVSGQVSRLAVLDGDELMTLVELDGVRYIWDVLVDGKKVYLATGIEGKLLGVDLAADDEPAVTELLDAEQINLLCIGQDDKGRIYTGSDTDGLIYRITSKADADADVFVLYDAAEPEIGALLVTADGTVFAGTADAEQARQGRLEDAVSEEAGRPEAPEQAPAEPEEPGEIP